MDAAVRLASLYLRARRVRGAQEICEAWRSAGDPPQGTPRPPGPERIDASTAVLPVVHKGSVHAWALIDLSAFSALSSACFPVSEHEGGRLVVRGLAEAAWAASFPDPAPSYPWAVGFPRAGGVWDLRGRSLYLGLARAPLAQGPTHHDPRLGKRPSATHPGVYLWTEGPSGRYWRAYLPDGTPVRSNQPGRERVVETATEEEAARERERRMWYDGWLSGWARIGPPRKRRRVPPAQGPDGADPPPPKAGRPAHACIRLCAALGRCVPCERWRHAGHAESFLYEQGERDPDFRVTSWLLEGLGTWWTRCRSFQGAGGRFDLRYAHALWERDRELLRKEREERAARGAPPLQVSLRGAWGPPAPLLRESWLGLEPWAPAVSDNAEGGGEADPEADPEPEEEGGGACGRGRVSVEGLVPPEPVEGPDGSPLPHRCTRLCAPGRHCPLHLMTARHHLLHWVARAGLSAGPDDRWMYEGAGMFQYEHGHPRSNRFDPEWMRLLWEADRRLLQGREAAPWPACPHPCVSESWREAERAAAVLCCN